jgi:NAD(P)-dependent dehydrogenase (short-subunit alcohol dehydrogenase family)
MTKGKLVAAFETGETIGIDSEHGAHETHGHSMQSGDRPRTNFFSGKIALVTGGASGIGEACARELADRGARLVIADINADQVGAVGHSIEGALRANVDVTEARDLERLAARLDDEVGGVDILVTCAGILQRPLPPRDLAIEAWDKVVAVDQRGVYITCRVFGERMASRGSGTIVNVASVAGQMSSPLHAYGPAKAAVIAMTENLAAEWGRSGVRVNAVAPGFVLTPALQAAVSAGERNIDAMLESSALYRLTEATDVAKACAFLASDDARAITGTTLTIDCGMRIATDWMPFGGVRASRASR